jgi:alpha-N-arabinofuranosidase
MRFDKKWIDQQVRKLVTTAFLGKAVIPDLPYEQPDGKPIRIDKDYLGKSRSESNPTPGPFENPGTGDLRLKVW